MGVGQLLKGAIVKVKDSNMHPVAKGVIIVALQELGALLTLG